VYKISITGPESTGKSLLTEALAAHFGGISVPEYAREYVENLGRDYTYDDVCTIAKKQIEEIEFYDQQPDCRFVFFDTDLIITKVWFEYCYGKVPEFLTKAMERTHFDLFLLCAPDLPWIPDPVRENGNIRNLLFERYRAEIELTGTQYHIVTGSGIARCQNAIKAVNTITNCELQITDTSYLDT
jgi:NadR type nicotinamide-nucleotide adenylyltransferase